MKAQPFRKLLLLLPILLLTACASNSMYRSNYESCVYAQPGDCAQNALQVAATGEPGEYSLGIVEYDDQGQLRDPRQMQQVLDEFRRLAAEDDVLLIAFVHGWHHSAKPEDNNIQKFREMLGRVSELEQTGSRQQDRPRRKVLGLYIGWRGDSISVPYLNAVTFWDRKSTAHDIGTKGVTELLLRLEEIVNVKKGMEQEVPPPLTSRLVVIGHSFGGAVVFTTLQNILADRFIDSRVGKTFQGDAQGFGDLVILMNPAFEAIRYSALYDLSQQGCRRYFNSQLPKLAILTSKADYATRFAFPVGRSFSTLFESHTTLERHYCESPGSKGIRTMQISEGEADRNTVGHFEPYLTHRLRASEDAPREQNFEVAGLQTRWARHTNDEPLDFVGSRLESLQRTTALNPYLNIRVDEELIGDHNDIWQQKIILFLRDLIAISTTPIAPAN